jgi:hypothetical protein
MALSRYRSESTNVAPGLRICGSPKTTVALILASVLALCLCGCRQGWVWNDPWHDDQEERSIPLDQSTEIKSWLVTQSQLFAAEERLAGVKIVAITEEEAKVLVGESPGDASAGHPYLVRAVYIFGPPQGFSVYLKDGELVVLYATRGLGTAWRVSRHALVVRLKAPPTKVLVWCDIGAV